MQKIIKRVFLIIILIGIIVLADIVYISLKDRTHHKQVESMLPKKTSIEVYKDKEIILFYSVECPNCRAVDIFITENKLDQKFDIRHKEVHEDKNLNLLNKAAQNCKIETDTIGIPFLWDRQKCIIGNQDIIDYFKEKMNEK